MSTAAPAGNAPRTWVLVLVGLLAAWFVVAWGCSRHAREANAALATMTDQIAAGDSAGAAASIESARSTPGQLKAASPRCPCRR